MVSLQPADAGAYITRRADHVKVKKDKCKEVAELIMDDLIDGKIADIDYTANPLHPTGLNESQHLNWVFLLDTLNFSFWPEDGEHYDVTYNGKKETGYLAMCAAFMKCHDKKYPIWDFRFMLSWTIEDLDENLKSDSGHSIPMLMDRYQAMHNGCTYMLKHFGGYYINMVDKNKNTGSAQTLLKNILMIESFRDQTEYKGQLVWILKRAQILISDTWGILKDNAEYKSLVDWKDLDTITMFADYRVPQVLSYFGCLEYSEKLLETLQKNELIKHGDQMEVELRGCSIYCVQEIFEEVKKLRKEGYKGENYDDKRAILPIDIDVWLWQYRRAHAEDVESLVPMHRTRSIYY